MLSKIIEFIKTKQSEIVLAIAMVLIAIIAFESGKITALRNLSEPLEIKSSSTQSASQVIHTPGSTLRNEQQVIASKNSTIYHFFWCSGAKRIKKENKITFSSEQEAQKRGYVLASNCIK